MFPKKFTQHNQIFSVMDFLFLIKILGQEKITSIRDVD